MKEDDLYRLMIFNYYVLFKIDHLEKDYKAIVPINTYEAS